MYQVIQSLKSGKVEMAELPYPAGKHGQVIIRSSTSLVSAGTERMLLEFGRANVLNKARRQPQRVAQVLDKARTDGWIATYAAVRSKLDQPIALGYSSVGRVLEVGQGVSGLEPGDRVASNGPHAEIVRVPRNLCAPIPDNVTDEQAAFTVVGSVALQGIRLISPTLGESVVVTGLGLIGLIAIQLLRANGCRVLGIDVDPARCELARRFGVDAVDLSEGIDAVDRALRFSRGRGVDAVLVAVSTDRNEPLRQAARMCRKRGRIVLVGVAGMHLSRDDFYKKEITLQVSCSYGPGRYDPAYEEQGRDYPAGYVRWTEQRNFEAMLDTMAAGQLDLEPLISHRFPIAEAPKAYDLLAGGESSLGILLSYPSAAGSPAGAESSRLVHLVEAPPRSPSAGEAILGVIGAGNFASRVLLPAFAAAGAKAEILATTGGVGGHHVARKTGFRSLTTDVGEVFGHPAVNAVVIATRHDSHATLTCAALDAGQHVFVEKPLALTGDELDQVAEAYARAAGSGVRLMVGFNRRFAPLTVKMKDLLDRIAGPKSIILTVNAGALPAEHWTQDIAVGGGRIIGEACHFIDLSRFLAGAPIESVRSSFLTAPSGEPRDTATIELCFADGSTASIHYLANGHRGFPKERVEVFCGGTVLQLDNFIALRGFGVPGFTKKRLLRQDKGHAAGVRAFIESIAGGKPSPIPFDQLIEVARATLQAALPV